MKKQLVKLIRTVEETQLVERLIAAKSTAERVKICEEAMETPEFQTFNARYFEIVAELGDDEYSAVSSGEFTFTKENIVAVAIILILNGIDEFKMFDDDDCNLFYEALREVDGTQKEVAEKIVHLLGNDDGDEFELISHFWTSEILEKIF